MMFNGWGELATEENCAAWINLEQCVSSVGQVDRLDKPSVQATSLDDMSIEISQALDFDQTTSHDAAFCQAPRLPSRGESIVAMTTPDNELVEWLLEGDTSIPGG
jgi:hypothetical protein